MSLPERIANYRIEERIGTGGMGEVHRAWDEDLERPVAVKFIRVDGVASVRAQERFRREALTARLVHPAIVQIHHVLEWQKGDCIVMELVEGRTLKALTGDGPVDWRQALPWFREIAEGLAYAHARGIVHRDLKTDNVMITASGHAKVLDFGLAKHLDRSASLSVDGQIVGTLHSMSPEQASGLEVDRRSDLFSLGVLFYEVLTGQSPFRGENARETLAKVCMHRHAPVRQVMPEVPAEASDLIDALLEKDRDQRPQSAEEVVAVLGRLAGAEIGDAAASLSAAPPAAEGNAPAGAGLRDTPTIDSTGSTSALADGGMPRRSEDEARPRAGPSTSFSYPRWRLIVAALIVSSLVVISYMVLLKAASEPNGIPEALDALEDVVAEGRYQEAQAAIEDLPWPELDRSSSIHALLLKADVLQLQEEYTGAEVALDQAGSLVDREDGTAYARYLMLRGSGLAARDDFGGARDFYSQALTVCREVDDLRGAATAENSIANILLNQGEVAQARERFKNAFDIFQSLGDHLQAAAVVMNLGTELQIRGQLKDACESYQEALGVFAESGNDDYWIVAATNLGECLLLSGRPGEALERYREALARSRMVGDRVGRADSHLGMGKIYLLENEPENARNQFEEAAAICEQDRNWPAAAKVKVAQARLSLAEQDVDQAQRLAIAAEQVLKQDFPTETALARTVIAECHLRQGEPEAAREVGEQARAAAEAGGDRHARYRAAMLSANLRARSAEPGAVAAALTELDGVARDAAESGFLLVAFEARLAAAAIREDAGQLATLEEEARTAGLGLFAKRAAELREALGGSR